MTYDDVLRRISPWHCLKDPDKELPAILDELKGATSFLEIGTFKGATVSAIALALPDIEITTVDLPDPTQAANNAQSSQQCGEAIYALGLATRIKQLRMDSAELWQLIADGYRYDCVFVDGDHSAKAVFRDLSFAVDLLTPKGFILAHDYTDPNDADRPPWTKDVYRAVEMFLTVHPEYRSHRLPGWLVALKRFTRVV
jgi:predicted O-methyltransferase YrrM